MINIDETKRYAALFEVHGINNKAIFYVSLIKRIRTQEVDTERYNCVSILELRADILGRMK